MGLLVAALLAALAVGVLTRTAPVAGESARRAWSRRAAVALVVALPALYAWALLAASGERLGALSIEEVGKRLAFGPDLPATAGGTDADTGRAEDLHAPRLPAGALVVRPGEGGGLAFELGSPAPAVEVAGELRNEVAIEDGDVIEIAVAGGEPLALELDGGALALADRRADLPAGWLVALRGSDRVVFLRDLLAGLEAEGAARPLSFLRYRGGWRLVIREREVVVRRPGGELVGLAESFEAPSPARVRLGVVLGEPGDRDLVWLRDDRLERVGKALEVRYARPARHLAEVDPDDGGDGPRELALVAPGTFDRRDMIELDEPSARFRGLAARLDAAPDGPVRLDFLGSRREVRLGEVYGLGEGEDLLLLRFGRESFPWRLLLDLALLGLFLAVFLGPSLAAEPGLAAFTAPAGLLLANRLLFIWKAASRPPDFPVEALAEARLALWLVPGLLLAGWSLAWALGRGRRATGRAVRWPVGGLVVAAAGCFVVGDGGDRWLALLPLALAGLLAAVPGLAARPAVTGRLQRWRREGIPWRLGWLLAAGLAILAARALFAALGMPEALRVPGGGRLLLWTVVQIPLCTVLVALSLVAARRRLDEAAAGGRWVGDPAPARRAGAPDVESDFGEPPPRGPASSARSAGAAAGLRSRLDGWLARRPGARWPLAVVALLAFLGLAFAAVAAVVGDLGLLLVQGLPFALALLLVVTWPRGVSPRTRWAVAAGLLLAVLPAIAVVTVNRWPEVAVRALEGGGGGDGQATVAVRDRVAELSGQRAQQVFRLYLLANPSALREVGLEPSDRTAVQYETLQGYAAGAGWTGGGFLSAPLPRHLGSTYLSDLVPMVFVLPELGRAGLLGLALLYLLPLGWLASAGPAGGRLGEQGTMLAAVAGVVFAVPGLYMILANLNLVLFSGKNTPLLGLNSLSDALETALVLAAAAAGTAFRRAEP